MTTSNTPAKIGAAFYIIWACLHLLAAYSVYVLGRSLNSSMVQGRLFQDAWNLLFLFHHCHFRGCEVELEEQCLGLLDQPCYFWHCGYGLYLLPPCPRLYARLA